MQIFAGLMPFLRVETYGLAGLFELLDVAFGGDARLSRYKPNLSPLNA